MSHIDVSLITNDTSTQFLFSDCPATQWNAIVKDFGLRNVGAIGIYPISPNNLIFLYDKNCYKASRNITLKDNKIADEFNFYQLLNALNTVYVSNEESIAYAHNLWHDNAVDYTAKHGTGIIDYHFNLPFLEMLRTELSPEELNHYPILTKYKKGNKLSGDDNNA